MPAIHELIPNAEDLLALEPEELAVVFLQAIGSSGDGMSPGRAIKRGNLFLPGHSPVNGYPAQYRNRVYEALAAAWVWLEREGMLLPAPGQQDPDWVFISERGRALTTKENFDAYRYSSIFPRKALHPAIASSTFALFIRGYYDTVVFEAFRAVEVAVRQATGLPQELVGSPLMRKAFDVHIGALTDTSLVPSEKQAMSDLFAGAMGLFKNPPSHRSAAISKPEDAVDLVMFANYLLRLVDQRAGFMELRFPPPITCCSPVKENRLMGELPVGQTDIHAVSWAPAKDSIVRTLTAPITRSSARST